MSAHWSLNTIYMLRPIDADSELGIATHYVNSRRVPMMLDSIATIDNASIKQVNQVIEENVEEGEATEAQFNSIFTGPTRKALDFCFRHDKAEDILKSLREFAESADEDPAAVSWAKKTIETLKERSPTSIKVSLRAIRQAKVMTLFEALRMELRISTAYVVSTPLNIHLYLPVLTHNLARCKP